MQRHSSRMDGYPWRERDSAELSRCERRLLAKAERAQPMGQLVKPDQVAGLAAYMLSPESGVMTGALVDYDQNVVGAYSE
jgi:enoyl-[acyl-carrier-protein] reductase (NADH)